MERIILGFIFAAMQVLPGLAGQKPKPSVELIFSPDHIMVMSQDDLDLSVKWVNNSDQTVNCASLVSDSIYVSFVYDVRRSDGKPVPRSSYKDLSQFDPPGPPCRMRPGSAGWIALGRLLKAYDMRQPGVYTVRVSRTDLDHPDLMLGPSNILTVTVMAPK
jgi:hypothetical protein